MKWTMGERLDGSIGHVWYYQELPNGWLYSTKGKGLHPTKITAADLPKSYFHFTNYKRPRYINTAGIKSLYYKGSPFDNHYFKDDDVMFSYHGEIDGTNWDTLLETSDSFVWGNEIVPFVAMVEKYSGLDVTEIKQQIVDHYNWVCDRNKDNQWLSSRPVARFEELLH